MAAVGDIDAAELSRQLDRAFGGLPAGAAQPALPDWTPPAKPRTVIIERPVPQSSVLIAMPGIPRDDPDWHAALVMAHILGGGQQSRLFSEVREKRGLAYSVSAGLRVQRKAVAAGDLDRQRQRARRRVAAGHPGRAGAPAREGVTDQELADAKTYLSGSLALSLDSSGSVASLLHSHAGRSPAARLSRPAGGADRRGQGARTCSASPAASCAKRR